MNDSNPACSAGLESAVSRQPSLHQNAVVGWVKSISLIQMLR